MLEMEKETLLLIASILIEVSRILIGFVAESGLAIFRFSLLLNVIHQGLNDKICLRCCDVKNTCLTCRLKSDLPDTTETYFVMNEFSERYKHLSSVELMKIIEDPQAYQPEAVDAARFVLDSRALGEGDLQTIRHKLEQERIKEQALIQRTQDAKFRLTQLVSTVLNNINPAERNASTAEKLINLIAIIYGTYVLYFSVINAWIFSFIIKENKALFETDFIVLVLPLILLAPALVLFYMKKKVGWIMLICYFLYSFSTLMLKFLLQFFEDSNLFEPYSRFQPMRFLTIVLYAVTLWYLYKTDVRNAVSVDMNTTIFVTGLILSLIGFNWYWHYGT